MFPEFLSLVTIRLLGSCARKEYDQQHDLNFSAEDVEVVFFIVPGFTVVFNRLFLGCCFKTRRLNLSSTWRRVNPFSAVMSLENDH